MTFEKWIDTFVEEKGIDTEHLLTAEGASGTNYIPVGCLIEAMKAAPKSERDGIKTMLVKIDFARPGPAPVLDYFNHLAKAIAI